MRIFSFFVLTSLVIAGCENTQYSELLNNNCSSLALEQTITDDELEYSIALPSDYFVERDYDILDFSSVKPTDREDYIESCGLTVMPNSLNLKLNEFYSSSLYQDEEGYKDEYGDFNLVEQGNVVLNDVDFIWNTYRYGNEQTLNFFSVANGNTYRLIFLSNRIDFDSVFCTYANIAKSFKLGESAENSL